MANWKFILSIVLIVASIVYSAFQSWVAALYALFMSVVAVALFMLTLKFGGNRVVKLAYCVVMGYLLLGVVLGVYVSFDSVPKHLELNQYGWGNLILSIMKQAVPSLLLLIGNVFPLIYCIKTKKEI